MQLTLLKKNIILSCMLPEKRSGQYWITYINVQGDEERIISIEGIANKWILKSNKHATIQDEKGGRIKEIDILPLCFYPILLDNNEKALLYAEPITEDRRSFKKLLLPRQGKLILGRAEDCDISYSNIYTSSRHAEIVITENDISINDLNSSNGTFVNGIRVDSKSLIPGDVIYIMGLNIILCKGFIAVNNPDGKMSYNQSIFKKFTRQQAIPADDERDMEEETAQGNHFYRSPRFKRDIEIAKIKIDPPPTAGIAEQIPLALMLGPSITMGMTSLFTGLLTLQNVLRTHGDVMTAMPTLVMSFSMLVGTILWPLLTKRYEKKKRAEREKLRQEKYRDYLGNVRKVIEQECIHQSEILNENHVSAINCTQRIQERQRNLWERSLGQNDFLRVRLGMGDLPLEAEIKYPEKKFTMEDDNLNEELYKLVEEPKFLRNVPVTLSLEENRINGVIGDRRAVVELVKGLIIQLTALHSYDELKLVFIYDQKEKNVWNFVKWLPHVWNEKKTIRFIATNPSEVKELSSFFEKEITAREDISNETDLKEICPCYIIFAMSKSLASKAAMIDLVLKQKKNCGFSLIALYDELKNLPKECSRIIELDGELSKMYDKDDITGKYLAFKPDELPERDAEEIAVDLANIQLKASAQSYNLPNLLTFLEMLGVGKIEHLNALTRWRDNDPTITLEAPVGIDTSGELFKLDLHEKYHGPHGLIAGMTGSGKSEFIMTFILSLALNYHPYEVAFILIDYKGGGMANTFSQLPHLVGTITNLDGAAVKRSLVSIQSELKRRQAIFSETSKKVNVSNIDIYKYQRLYRDGVVKEPLQHLFIISDEFAELKTQQPEFMQQLVSAARIGRSLGVHLILATQKPSGVVDDQIWSNSKFRVCLKVQERADSMDVIKRPDAAELSVTGRFFMQVGFNELFQLGQSAWGGAPYYPSDRVEKDRDDSVLIIDNLGRVIKQARSDKRKVLDKNPPKQIDEIVKYLKKLAEEEKIRVKPLWLEPIPEIIIEDELRMKYTLPKAGKFVLNPIIGEYDDPENQRQSLLTLPMTKEGNAVIYGAAGSGKTTMLTTIIHSLMKDHTPSEINLYIMDFGSETLRVFAKAPHVGDVMLSHASEKINNLFKMLNQEIESRKKLFSDYGGEYQSYVKTTGTELPSIVIIIHNYSAFAELYDDKEESVAFLTREGTKYGIYFILTALNTNAVRYRVLQNFKQLYVLQLNDKTDYTGILGNVDGVYPGKYKGRGIFKSDKVYEFQCAQITRKTDGTLDFVRSYCSEYASRWKKAPAKRIPILPEIVDASFLLDAINRKPGNIIPIGVEKSSLNIADYCFDNAYINLILSQNNDNADFIQGLAEIMAYKGETSVVVIDPNGAFSNDDEKKYQYVDSEFNKSIVNLFAMLVHRNNTVKEAKELGKTPPLFDKTTCIITSLSGLLQKISDDCKDKLKVFLEKGDLDLNMNFVLAESIGNIPTFSFDNWFKTKVSLNDGIWIGNGISEQYQLKISKTSDPLRQEIGDSFGYTIRKGKATLLKLLSSTTGDAEVPFDEQNAS